MKPVSGRVCGCRPGRRGLAFCRCRGTRAVLSFRAHGRVSGPRQSNRSRWGRVRTSRGSASQSSRVRATSTRASGVRSLRAKIASAYAVLRGVCVTDTVLSSVRTDRIEDQTNRHRSLGFGCLRALAPTGFRLGPSSGRWFSIHVSRTSELGRSATDVRVRHPSAIMPEPMAASRAVFRPFLTLAGQRAGSAVN
jgi:hypothetical protein